MILENKHFFALIISQFYSKFEISVSMCMSAQIFLKNYCSPNVKFLEMYFLYSC